MRAKTTAIAIIFSLTLLSTTWLVFAQENMEISEDGTADTEKIIPCEKLEANFDEKVEKFLLSEPTHTYKYQVLWLKTSAIVRKADIMGYDVEDLEENLDELDSLTTQFSNNFDRFIRQMINTRRYICSANETLYANSMKLTKDRLEDVQESARDINYLYQDEIRENLMELIESAEEIAEVEEEMTNE